MGSTESVHLSKEDEGKVKELFPKLQQEFEDNWTKLSESPKNNTGCLQDFQRKQALGKGSYGKVLLVTHKEDKSKYYAMKILSKEKIIHMKQVKLFFHF